MDNIYELATELNKTLQSKHSLFNHDNPEIWFQVEKIYLDSLELRIIFILGDTRLLIKSVCAIVEQFIELKKTLNNTSNIYYLGDIESIVSDMLEVLSLK